MEVHKRARRLPTGRWLLLLGATGILIVALSISLIQFTGIANSQTPNDADSTPCPTPILMEGKATGSASPAASATATSCVFAGKKPGIGTPVAVEGLQVNLHTDADYAGPVTLTVDVSAKDGAPVEGALVVVTTRSLEMNMGEFPHRADETDPGRYVADQVGMGMGGDWEIEVDVTVPGHPTAVAFFTVSLEGPM